ncbi:fimbrial protein [Burkholderia sp. AU16741]|uniref:fimbrial protein n=1 Tax=unclassified Burkholderia TaxID=2613784 RepID=UPI000B7A0FA8|nr:MULTISPECIES: fimbrial protein [unclassified Burkholderia]MDN7425965.1 fimbrial protein [Burkholderia sp. AU45388]OXI31291.1 fimbrial protein [Burkholderia sp. AU16741]
MRKMESIGRLSIVFGFWSAFCTGSAVAATAGDCSFYDIVHQPTVGVSVESYASWEMGEFDPSVPDGTVLSEAVASIVRENDVYSASCKTDIGRTTLAGIGTRGPYETYASSVSGVGLRLLSNDGKYVYPYKEFRLGGRLPLMALRNTRIQLVKTGPITAQGKVTGQIAQYTFDDKNLVVGRLYIAGSVEIKPKVPTCSVLTKTITVSMASTNAKRFTGVGSTSPGKAFDIRLNCGNGTSGATTKMYITMTDATHPANRSTMLSLSKDSTASGVGYQIVRQTDGSPVTYGRDSSEAGNPGQWFVGQYGNQSVDIPLVARYVQTQPKIAAGTANAAASFTMNYQ